MNHKDKQINKKRSLEMEKHGCCKSLDLVSPYCPLSCTFGFRFSSSSLPLTLSGVDWVLLDSCYLHDGDLSGWKDFLSDLGVRDLLIFRKDRRNLRSTELVRCPCENQRPNLLDMPGRYSLCPRPQQVFHGSKPA